MTGMLLRYKNSSLHYVCVGSGTKTLLIFHGFGQDHKVFESLSDSLSGTYTTYLFDLYFHGDSEWGYGESPLEKDHWKATVEQFLSENNVKQFCIAGFSLGGKFALATLEAFPSQTQEVFLLAPDGIKTSFWYSLATYPVIFRSMFKSMIRHHNRFMAIIRVLNFLGIMDKGLLRFAQHQMNTEQKRRRVYYSWVVYRRLVFDLSYIAKLINANKIPLTIITGKYDKVIRSENMSGLLNLLNEPRAVIMDTGHNGLIEAAIPYLKGAPHAQPPRKQ